MIFFVYNCLLTILSPIWIIWMVLRARARKEAPNWEERQGQYELPSRKDGKRIWIHAVSVGEVVAAMPILREVRSRLPDHEIVLSVTTSSGHQTAREKASDLFDHLFYAPIDVPRLTMSAVQKVRPSVLAIMETELWFNFLWAAKTFDAKTLLINGRISDRSFRKSKYLAFFYRPLLKNVDQCLMQTESDAAKIRTLGAGEVEVLGNCKFDQAVEGLDADPAHWRAEFGLEAGRPVIVVGSIRAEEFALLASVVAQTPGPYWIIAPRHVDRVDELRKALSGSTSVGLRSLKETGDVILLDTYGELSQIYSVADIVVVGGGFQKLGGQNILQPLAHGKPVLHGPYMANFRDVAAAAVASGASEVCRDAAELTSGIERLLVDGGERARRGEAAKELVQENLGASARYADAIAVAAKAFLKEGAVRDRRSKTGGLV